MTLNNRLQMIAVVRDRKIEYVKTEREETIEKGT